MTWVGLPLPTVPLTSGLFSFSGEFGSVSLMTGAAGGVESSTYTKAVEQPEVPAAFVAVALSSVDASPSTTTVMPPPVKVALLPSPAGEPEQSAVL